MLTERLKELREAHQLSQTQIAIELGTKQSTYSNWAHQLPKISGNTHPHARPAQTEKERHLHRTQGQASSSPASKNINAWTWPDRQAAL